MSELYFRAWARVLRTQQCYQMHRNNHNFQILQTTLVISSHSQSLALWIARCSYLMRLMFFVPFATTFFASSLASESV